MSEHDEQVLVIRWAKLQEKRWPELRWLIAIPNGAKLAYRKDENGRRKGPPPQAIKLKAEGMKAGVSDLFLPFARGGFFGLWVEIKFDKNKPTKDQEAFQDDMAEWGYCAVVCWSAGETITELENYLSKPTTTVLLPSGETWQVPEPKYKDDFVLLPWLQDDKTVSII
jgi:hypothetical protein